MYKFLRTGDFSLRAEKWKECSLGVTGYLIMQLHTGCMACFEGLVMVCTSNNFSCFLMTYLVHLVSFHAIPKTQISFCFFFTGNLWRYFHFFMGLKSINVLLFSPCSLSLFGDGLRCFLIHVPNKFEGGQTRRRRRLIGSVTFSFRSCWKY